MCKKLVFLLFFLVFSLSQGAFAQPGGNVTLKGTVVGADDMLPLSNCVVTVAGQPLWSITNQRGEFSIPGIKPGEYSLEITSIGYQKTVIPVDVHLATGLVRVLLNPETLELEEVVVTAKEQKMGSSSIIDRQAIEHLQAKSIADMLQLVPGNITQNPQMVNASQAMIREISYNESGALGVGLILDGAQVSNDANLQLRSYAAYQNRATNSDNTTTMQMQGTSGRGFDLRTISPNNIESIEVVRGVASAEYGNFTSGSIIVNTRIASAPWEIKGQVDANSKLASVGKGFDLGDRGGVINFSGDYSQSYSDIRTRYHGYERVTGNLGYSRTFRSQTRPFTLNIRASYFNNVNSRKIDADLNPNERVKNKYSGFRLNVGGTWRLKTLLVSNLDYNVSYSASHQNDYYYSYVTGVSGVIPVGTSYESGTYESFYIDNTYYSEYTMDGKPRDLEFKLKADKLIQFTSESFTTIKAGVSYNNNRNVGRGFQFDPRYPYNGASSAAMRPRNNKDIPALKNFSAFVEDKTGVAAGSTYLTLIAGVRFSNLFVDNKKADRRDIWVVEPRVNFDYKFLDKRNNLVFDELGIVGGFGISNKMPTLSYLYPDNAYFDQTSLGYMNSDGSEKYTIITTQVERATNPRLRPVKNKKYEIGIYGKLQGVNFSATFFKEKINNDYSFTAVPVTMIYPTFTYESGASNFSYDADSGILYYDDPNTGLRAEADVDYRTYLRAYSTPSNNTKTRKHGVEYVVSFPEIRPLRTTLTVDGSWIYVKRRTNGLQVQTHGDRAGVHYEYFSLGYYNNMGYNGTQRERISSAFRFVTHIPQLKMVFTTTAEVIWKETYKVVAQDENGRDMWYYADNGMPNVDPYAYMDAYGNVMYWDESYRGDDYLKSMVQVVSHENYYGTERYPFYITLNFRLTKEFGRNADLSFMANNFLNSTNKYKRKTSRTYDILSNSMYFGAELRLKF